jgi:putative iron-regulated protein
MHRSFSPVPNLRLALSLTTSMTLAACGGDDGVGLDDAPPAVSAYVALVHQSYADAVTGAKALATAIDTFVAAPSAQNLALARQAWIDARVSYRQTEVYRFYGGPIDDADNDVELGINSWPLDEVIIDYVDGDPSAGLINDPAGVPNLTAEVVRARNMNGGEANVTLGYHAIEFLLWGQDRASDGPGNRPHTDYVVGAGGTAANQARRAEYLQLVADLLVEDLETVRDAWVAGQGYAAEMTATAPREALRRMLTGIGTMAASELSGERMLTAYENKDQEDEHSCFSDTTLADIAGNLQGIENVYFGNYGALDGAGIDTLVAARNPALDAKMRSQLTAAKAAVAAIPGPFDQAISGGDDAPGRVKVLAAVRAIQALGNTIVEIADELGITISVDL